ncbi:class I SAM-dependent methyltransferase [Rhodopseudomonas sp. HC1]|uniref:class I SAM-dependent methyltransferase n=1 Tax=Rhodopseudomonas infernalis TaxID=2897386 RepID=UPI001EE88936|nr:class I SAM-dependent methyltransferase [Rhodopseudomonas infernalis]MCG6207037.1 class I SAM-dependent methyltransferase [Rhodopseudomonas infernalis]
MTDRSTQFWDRVAERYAARPIKDVAAYDAMLADAATRLSPTDRVLEIGCGTGGTAIRLAPHVAHYRATDGSAEMIRIAKAKPAPANLDFVVADAGQAFDGAPFDAICALLVLHLVPDMAATLRAIHQHLVPGGLLISKTYCFRDMNFVMRRLAIPALQLAGLIPRFAVLRAEQLRHAIAAAGFAIEDGRTFGTNRHAHYIVARKLAQ